MGFLIDLGAKFMPLIVMTIQIIHKVKVKFGSLTALDTAKNNQNGIFFLSGVRFTLKTCFVERQLEKHSKNKIFFPSPTAR